MDKEIRESFLREARIDYEIVDKHLSALKIAHSALSLNIGAKFVHTTEVLAEMIDEYQEKLIALKQNIDKLVQEAVDEERNAINDKKRLMRCFKDRTDFTILRRSKY